SVGARIDRTPPSGTSETAPARTLGQDAAAWRAFERECHANVKPPSFPKGVQAPTHGCRTLRLGNRRYGSAQWQRGLMTRNTDASATRLAPVATRGPVSQPMTEPTSLLTTAGGGHREGPERIPVFVAETYDTIACQIAGRIAEILRDRRSAGARAVLG